MLSANSSLWSRVALSISVVPLTTDNCWPPSPEYHTAVPGKLCIPIKYQMNLEISQYRTNSRLQSAPWRLDSLHWSQGPVSISDKTSYRKISQSLEVARFVFRIVRSLWNLTGTSAALLPMCLSNFKAIRQFKEPISGLRDFTRSYDKTSFRILTIIIR